MNAEPLNKTTLAAAANYLAKRDRALGSIFAAYGTPPMWARQPGFTTLIRIILEQQVSLASAATMYQRLRSTVIPFRPNRFVELGEPHFKSLGLTRQKTAYCLDLAACVNARNLSLAALSKKSDKEIKASLMQVKGIGPWTADIYLLMALRRPDIWPTGDVALITAVTKVKNLRNHVATDRLLDMAEAWRPYRSVAARMLWQYYLAQRKERRMGNRRARP